MYQKLKRVLDIVGATVGLVLAALVMLATAVLIKVTMGEPVLFRQRRPGLNEKAFTCLKFRTMTDERDSHGSLLSDEQRLTRVGLFLRRTSLDELPQLWNILTGELSFIGPRPLLESYLPYYLPAERKRHSVRPGLTGWAQIHGRNGLNFNERLSLDVWYVEHVTFCLDIHILFATIWIIISQKGFMADQPIPALDLQRSVSGVATGGESELRDANETTSGSCKG